MIVGDQYIPMWLFVADNAVAFLTRRGSPLEALSWPWMKVMAFLHRRGVWGSGLQA